jgi:MATE family multidrug resistance protein
VIGLLFMVLNILEKNLINCMGHQNAPMVISIVTSIMHLGICHVLTYNFELGIKAPPIATAIYLFNQFIILHLYVKFFVKDEKVQQAWLMPSKSSFNVNGLIEFLRIGIPSIGVLCLDWWSFEIMMIFASGLSVQAVAVQVLIITTGGTFFMVHVGICISSGILVGQNIGALKVRQAKSFCNLTQLISLANAFINSSIVYIFSSELASLYT